MTPRATAAVGLHRDRRHGCWGHLRTGHPCPLKLFSCSLELDSRKGSAQQDLFPVSWEVLSAQVPRNKQTNKQPRLFCLPACLPQFLFCSQEPCFCSMGMGSQRKTGARATLQEHGGDVHFPPSRRTVTHRWRPPTGPWPHGCRQIGSPWS